jgi:hypothetical protein
MHAYIQNAKYFALTGEPAITEVAVGGAGTVTFAPACACKIFTPGQEPIDWLKNRKCADGAILVADDDGHVTAHLVELKSKLKAGDWASVKAQLEGLLHNVHALCAITGSPPPSSVRAYVAFKLDAISSDKMASPVLYKAPLGTKHAQPYSTVDWEAGEISLLGKDAIPLIKIQRDEQGHAEAALLA